MGKLLELPRKGSLLKQERGHCDYRQERRGFVKEPRSAESERKETWPPALR